MKQTLTSKRVAYAETIRIDKIALEIMRQTSCGIEAAYLAAIHEPLNHDQPYIPPVRKLTF